MHRWFLASFLLLFVCASVAVGHDGPHGCPPEEATCAPTVRFIDLMTDDGDSWLWSFASDGMVTQVTVNGQMPSYDHGDRFGAVTTTPLADVTAIASSGQVAHLSTALIRRRWGRMAVFLDRVSSNGTAFYWRLRQLRPIAKLRFNGQQGQRFDREILVTTSQPTLRVMDGKKRLQVFDLRLVAG